jgi:hypothetical protein
MKTLKNKLAGLKVKKSEVISNPEKKISFPSPVHDYF